MVLDQPVIKATFSTADQIPLTVSGHVAKPADFANVTKVYALIVDTAGVISPDAWVSVSADYSFYGSLHPSSNLAVGSYTGNLQLKLCRDEACNSQFPGSPMSLPYELHVAPPGYPTFAAVPAQPVAIRMHLDGDVPAAIPVDVRAEGRTWRAAAGAAWIKLDTASGSGSTKLNVSVDAKGLAAGTYTANVTLTSVDAVTSTFPVTLTIDAFEHKVLASEAGVAFTSVPGWSRLSRTLTVSDNLGKNTRWSAHSDQAWLSVTSAGQTAGDNKLTLTVNPAALPADAISYATVTLGGDNGASAPEPVKVAVWKGSSTPSATVTSSRVYQKMVSDPVRPWVYAHNGGATVDIYNLYTGQLEGSVTGLPAQLGQMSVSPNGDRLYVLEGSANIVVIDLASRKQTGTWPMLKAGQPTNGWDTYVKAMRINGVELVLGSDGSVFVAATGKRLPDSGIGFGKMTVSADGRVLAAQDESKLRPLYTANLDYTDTAGGTLRALPIPVYYSGRQIALSADGQRLYVTDGTRYQCSWTAVGTGGGLVGLDANVAYQNNVQVGSDGRIYCGFDSYYEPTDILVYDTSGTLLKTMYNIPASAGNLMISGDGLLVVTVSGSQIDQGVSGTLNIAPVGP
ncbi:hypothetical protein D0T23_14335 [Duganella sp. BJB475]|nr:hypothetical protein D0T23_14335 [Duganella sp. BJB475]RFP36293.1 hypothetical protein D0T21_07690 [Duganella sp. BJB476]